MWSDVFLKFQYKLVHAVGDFGDVYRPLSGIIEGSSNIGVIGNLSRTVSPTEHKFDISKSFGIS